MRSNLGIYVHIPFCESKCAYCDFASFVVENKQKYFDFLLNEINSSSEKGRSVDTIYIGGGTPSSVNEKYVEAVLSCIRNNFKVDDNAEITIEANPNSASYQKLSAYFDMGINRVSFGVQTLDDDALKELGRRHTSSEALEAISNAHKVGFKNISADLMLGIPQMDLAKTLDGARRLIQTGVTHISCYMLQVEKGTPLEKRAKTLGYLPSEDETVEFYQSVIELLKKHGFKQYEVSNFAREGYQSRHNLKYWAGEEYIGFGLSASSYLKEKRITNACTFENYYDGKKQVETLTKENKILEKIMLGLRCFLGFSKSELKSLGYDISQNDNFKEYIKKGILFEEGDNITLNSDFYGVNNYIITSILK